MPEIIKNSIKLARNDVNVGLQPLRATKRLFRRTKRIQVDLVVNLY